MVGVEYLHVRLPLDHCQCAEVWVNGTVGLFDRITGTRRPVQGTVPRSVEEVRDALLGLGGDPAPFWVREEKTDLVAECRVYRVGVTLRTRMRLQPAECEVRFLEERWESRSGGGGNKHYGRGYAPAVYWDGKDFRFSTREMTEPLRDAVLGAGWTWRGVFRL
ncbi:hypothetical protein [Streptomyces sp. NPDC021969]|uniref:hypothetical protein n=1 Tax=unclassified Streptomyces TaxID=2593676 RepID=UPI003408642A